MRLGKIKYIFDQVINEQKQIILESDAIYGGQAQIVHKYIQLTEVFNLLITLGWNDVDYSQAQEIFSKYKTKQDSIQIEQAEFNVLNAYFNSVNSKLPVYYTILETMCEKQDEKTINIKLSSKIENFEDLNKTNKRLADILKLFNVGGEFTFKEFDKGTNWYVVITTAVLSYRFILACLHLVQEFFKTKEKWFKSEEAKISYEIAKKQNSKITQEKFQDEWLDSYLENKIKKIIEKIGENNGASDSELLNKLLMGTKELIKEIDIEGTEFHLSLNPPSYADERSGSITIDYKKIQELTKKENEKVKDNTTKEIAEGKKS